MVTKKEFKHYRESTGRFVWCQAATPEECRVNPIEGDDDVKHFTSDEEGYAYLEKKNKEKFGEYAVVSKSSDTPVPSSEKKTVKHVYLDGQLMPEDHAEDRQNIRNHAQEVLRKRITKNEYAFEKPASPDATQKKMKLSVDGAMARGNTVLARQLSNAYYLPSGVVHTQDGKYDVNEAVRLEISEKHLESQSKDIKSSVAEFVVENKPAHGTYKSEVDGVKVTITVAPEANKTQLADLQKQNPELWEKISKPAAPKYTATSLKDAGFTDEELKAVKKERSKYTMVVSTPPDTGQQRVQANTDLGDGDVSDAVNDDTTSAEKKTLQDKKKLEQAATNLASLHKDSFEVTGTTSAARKKNLKDQKEIAKEAASAQDMKPESGGAFYGARKYGNGGLVTWESPGDYGRGNVEAAFKGDARLDEALIKDRSLNLAQAREVLSEKDFNRLYSNTAVRYRIDEKELEKD